MTATLNPYLMTADSYTSSIGAVLAPMLTNRDPLLASLSGFPTVGYNADLFNTPWFPKSDAVSTSDPTQTPSQAVRSSQAGGTVGNQPSYDSSGVTGTGSAVSNILNPNGPAMTLSPYSKAGGNATQTTPTSDIPAQDAVNTDIGFVNKAGLILLAVVIVGVGAYAFVKS